MKTRIRAATGLVMLASILLAILPGSGTKSARGTGWIDDPAAVRAVRDSLAVPCFADTEAGRASASASASASAEDDVYLWDACRAVTGDLLPPRDQGSVGACVGFGTASAIEHLICVQAQFDRREEFRSLAPEIIYAGSRVEIGGGTVRGDGSVGAWAARFVNEYGVLSRNRYPGLDLSNYSTKRCRELGRRGVPDRLEPEAKEHPVRAIANVSSWSECLAAIRNGYPMIVCSNQGFRFERDAEGFCEPSGTWMHCMAIVGIRGGTRPGAFLLNSWGGSVHTGPSGAGDPSPAGFWADARIVDAMLRQGDSWAFSQFTGFPARLLNWAETRNRSR